MSRIFISYRRDDSKWVAGRICDRLNEHFGENQIFMDIGTIKPGEDFDKAIEQAVGKCQSLIALIGKQWLTITDSNGKQRIFGKDDFVRLEIATALLRKSLSAKLLRIQLI